MGWHVLGDDRSGTDERMSADGQPTHDCDACPQGGARLDERWQQLLGVEFDVGAGSQVIGEGDAWTEEHIIGDVNAIEQHDLVLDRDAVAHSCAAFDVGSVADVAVGADSGAFQNVCKCPYTGAIADIAAFADSLWVHE